MISEFFLNIVFGIAHGALSALPDVSWSVDTSGFEFFLDIVRVAGYMFPAGVVSAIGTFLVVTTLWRIGVAAVRGIWDLLPFA